MLLRPLLAARRAPRRDPFRRRNVAILDEAQRSQ
jgi:hypothetical protein